jgi:hypothetical protein
MMMQPMIWSKASYYCLVVEVVPEPAMRTHQGLSPVYIINSFSRQGHAYFSSAAT